ncbi:hypothetical protein LCGC14_2235320 [marine sediment metagenome]|uniref:Uncharacterized protein n=1 Tax=marine sediment metagenome TaxID=412755 RepID=A0A0F9D7A2_9ZZZZ
MKKWLSTLIIILILTIPSLSFSGTQNGTITSDEGTVAMPLRNQASAAVNITGVWTSTIVFEVSNDFNTWTIVDVRSVSAQANVESTIINGYFTFTDLNGAIYVRVRATGLTTGTIIVALSASMGRS